jgi:Ca-activated chloride channel family protein
MVAVTWTGPANAGDYVTIVPKATPDGEYANYDNARAGATAKVTAPIEAGDCEIRYMSGQGHRVLARRSIKIVAAAVTLAAPAEAIAGAVVTVEWTGPANAGDFITIVPKTKPDGEYANYDSPSVGGPAKITAPIEAGDCEIRYTSGQGHRVLARCAIRIVAAVVTLSGPAEAKAGSVVVVEWTGPANAGDYVTIVPATAADGEYGGYDSPHPGTPAKVAAPPTAGDCEIRYISGQGRKVLARRPLRVVAVPITLHAPDRVPGGAVVSIDWIGPDNAGDYLTIVLKSAAAGASANYAYTQAGSPARVAAPMIPGPCEVRYMSGQGNRVLARVGIEVILNSADDRK